MSELDVQDGQANVSNLYATVNIETKNKKTKLSDKRISNKYEFLIQDISESLPELSNSDSNIYTTLLTEEEIRDSLSCSRTLFGSADDIVTEQTFSDSDQTEATTGSHLMRYGTGPIRKIPPPPPAKPPPYQKGEPDTHIISKEMLIRRSKSTNSKARFKSDNRLPAKSDSEDFKTCKKLGIQSFRRHKETPDKSTSGLVVSTSTPLKAEVKTTVPLQLPFKKCPLTTIPQERKLSPPDASKLAKRQSPPENNNKTASLPIPLPPQTILRPPPPPPTNPKPTLMTRPPLRPPILLPNPGNRQISSLPNMSPVTDPPDSPNTSKAIKHPNRLPPPPPSYSLTLPRYLGDKPKSQAPPVGDYTLLTPLSPESSSVDHLAFSSLPTDEPSSPPSELGPLISDEGYSVLNIDDFDNTIQGTDTITKSFSRTHSLPPVNSVVPKNSDVTASQPIPPKKPPRRMTSTSLSPTSVTSTSDYTILSSVDSDVGLFIENQNLVASIVNGMIPSSDNKSDSIRNMKTMTIASHGARPIPPKPAAYRARSKSHNVDNNLSIKPISVDHTKSVEVPTDSKPVKQQVETASEGLLHRMSKKFKNKTRAEIIIPSISTPILDTISHKLIGLNTLLVSQCVAYLKQPISLREEGLFRVPGDCNQINMYLKQFDYSLKPNLDEELDPNNVSCLLKIHIRINGGLLPKKEAGEMYAAVRQKNIEEISSVIKTISAQQQSILKEVLFLFKEVSEHQDENKMCSGAIATSCGLSIFPVVNAGNANLMLKVLIDNVEEIFQQ